jgi:hypothetical protein
VPPSEVTKSNSNIDFDVILVTFDCLFVDAVTHPPMDTHEGFFVEASADRVDHFDVRSADVK